MAVGPVCLGRLLGPALAASDALARLDAPVGAISEPVREGLVRRLALHEAAGWLATQGARVHPLDLVLRTGGLAGTPEADRAATEDLERRSRLPDALDAALRTPVLAPT